MICTKILYLVTCAIELKEATKGEIMTLYNPVSCELCPRAGQQGSEFPILGQCCTRLDGDSKLLVREDEADAFGRQYLTPYILDGVTQKGYYEVSVCQDEGTCIHLRREDTACAFWLNGKDPNTRPDDCRMFPLLPTNKTLLVDLACCLGPMIIIGIERKDEEYMKYLRECLEICAQHPIYRRRYEQYGNQPGWKFRFEIPLIQIWAHLELNPLW